MSSGGATTRPPTRQRRPLPPAQAHRSAGKGMLIAIVVALVILFALVMWSRHHRTQQPPRAPLHEQTRMFFQVQLA